MTAPHYAPDYDESGEEVIDRMTVEWLLDKLTPEQREILELRFLERLSYEEIGAVIGVKYRDGPLTGSAVRYHQQRILAQ